jgi:flagella basal body P-ring formation protein FlgA
VVTSGHIVVPPAVRSGDEVTAGVTIGRVHVTAPAVASGSGQVGDVIYVLQPGRRTRLKVRVVDVGVVEVVP